MGTVRPFKPAVTIIYGGLIGVYGFHLIQIHLPYCHQERTQDSVRANKIWKFRATRNIFTKASKLLYWTALIKGSLPTWETCLSLIHLNLINLHPTKQVNTFHRISLQDESCTLWAPSDLLCDGIMEAKRLTVVPSIGTTCAVHSATFSVRSVYRPLQTLRWQHVWSCGIFRPRGAVPVAQGPVNSTEITVAELLALQSCYMPTTAKRCGRTRVSSRLLRPSRSPRGADINTWKVV
ncbi:hypothetical protein F4861DRAFT_438812 [Xylaria intraflava]|nr:hypothetical protein F4861DRAFT_438812 [Xylaria intraflava]